MEQNISRTREEVNELLSQAEAARANGVSYTKFCADNNIRISTFRFWKNRKVRETNSESLNFTRIQKTDNYSSRSITVEYKGARILASNLEQLKIILAAIC